MFLEISFEPLRVGANVQEFACTSTSMHNFLISDTAALQFHRVQLWSKEYVGEHPHFESDLENLEEFVRGLFYSGFNLTGQTQSASLNKRYPL